jgi:hypothetical protein
MQASTLVTVGILGISLLVAGGFAWAYAEAQVRLGHPRNPALRRALTFAALWMALTGGAAASGLLARFDLRPPPMAFMFVVTVGLALGLGLSRVGDTFARGLPLAVLVGLQGFRFPLELVMHAAAREGTMPHEMSFTGLNFDIVTGLSALLLLSLARPGGDLPRGLVWAWSVLGSFLLANIGCVAVLASPMIQAFGSDPAHVNRWVVHFPFVFLPTVLVACAVFGHVVVFRALAIRADNGNVGRRGLGIR